MALSPSFIRYDTVVVGSGAAGLAAACQLARMGVSVALVTEGMEMGTSRNTGSDKQTYYKLSLLDGDKITDMASDLFSGGAVDGDLALVEAALSYPSFCRLCDLGVPFPSNCYGEMVGYQTDHSTRPRATSAGPLTSQYMTRCWQRELEQLGLPVYDQHLAVQLLTGPKEQVLGLATLDLSCCDQAPAFHFFRCAHVVWATGGPAGVYADSVYPESQTGCTGVPLLAGAMVQNVTEWQYGLASLGASGVSFRWNLSGSYQQVLPRYFSTASDGTDPRDFLSEALPDPLQLLERVFLKGYQWPFDPRKAEGSSLIDLLVYRETKLRGRKVFLDFRHNPVAEPQKKLAHNRLPSEAKRYLSQSNALQDTPFQRLEALNAPAIQLFASHGIDLRRQPLEVAVCAQHHNGGFGVDSWYESNIKGLFVIGEACGSHGIYRPGGAALNAGQVGARRCAEAIRYMEKPEPCSEEEFISVLQTSNARLQKFAGRLLCRSGVSNVCQRRKEAGEWMSRCGGQFRSQDSLGQAAQAIEGMLEHFFESTCLSGVEELGEAFRHYQLLVTQKMLLAGMLHALQEGISSRGSYLAAGQEDGVFPTGLPEKRFCYRLDDGGHDGQIQQGVWNEGNPHFIFRPVRPIPEGDHWFERVWFDYRARHSEIAAK